jgi:predicted RNA-binding protein with TRAM domain
VKEGEEYDVEISEVSQRGDGIARVKNFVIFVAGAKQGEKVHIKVTEVRGRHAVGEVVGASSGTEGAAEEETPAEAAEESEAEGAEGAAAGSENKEDEGF